MGDRDRPRLAHLTTVDISLAILLGTELAYAVEAGWEVLAISAPGPYVAEVEALGVTHVAVPELTRSWDLRSDARAARSLLRVLRDLDLDVLHTHNPKPGVMGRVLGRVARVPVVVNTCHGLWVRPEDGLARKAAVYGTEVLASWWSDAELYQNDQDRGTLSPWVPRRRAWTVGNGVDLHRFHHDPAGRAAVRAELGVADDEVLVGGVGRMVAEKGIAEYVEAARRLGDRATFAWIGPTDEAKHDALDAELVGVRSLGMRSDMVAIYSALDVFVLPSHREGFSRSGMEAAACGSAMVLSDIRGCREIGSDDEHLLLAPPRDPDALTAAIGRLVDDAGLRARLGAAASERAHRSFDQRAIAQFSLDTYRRVAVRKGIVLPTAMPAVAGTAGTAATAGTVGTDG